MSWTLDTAHTTVSFSVRHMGLSKVRGQFTRFGGEVSGDPADVASARGRIEIEMASIDTGNPDRDAHLRSAELFDVDRFPTMVFEATSMTSAGDGRYVIAGDLTIKGVTRPVELEYEHGGEGVDPFGNHKVGGTLTTTIKRSDWGLKWNLPLDGGGWLVSDNVAIEIDVQLVQSRAAVESGVSA